MARTDKLAEAHERLTRAVEEIVSGEDWQQMLAVAARFHRYSPANVMLIRAQRPDATRVAGYRTWQSLGRQVLRGERGIAILAPCVYRARPVNDSDEERSPELARILRGFTVVYVFDQSQTEGRPIPEVAPSLLEGDAPAALWERLAVQVHAAGFTLSRGTCAPANGRTDFAARTVVVGADLAPAQAAKTLAHDLLTAPGAGPPLGRRDLFEWSRPQEDEEGRDDGLTARPGGAPGREQAGRIRSGWSGGDLDAERCAAR